MTDPAVVNATLQTNQTAPSFIITELTFVKLSLNDAAISSPFNLDHFVVTNMSFLGNPHSLIAIPASVSFL